MWVVENVEDLRLDNNVLNQRYGVRSSHLLTEYVSFFDDWQRAEQAADAMNELDRPCPCLICERHRKCIQLTEADVNEYIKKGQ